MELTRRIREAAPRVNAGRDVEIAGRWRDGLSHEDLAQMYGVTAVRISQIVRRSYDE
ncbi:sigma factor-like helix-turn-helix DNA-binding protein [Leucobacter sp. HY1910]